MLRIFAPETAHAAGGGAPGTVISKTWQTVFCVLFAIAVTAVVLSACSRGKKSSDQTLSKRVIPLGQPVPKGGGRYKVGNPYKIGGRLYRPAEQPGYNRVGVASWYGEMFHGRYTANGEIYDMNAITAAHPTLPLPTYARVTNLQNGRSLVVRVNDRGPYAQDRIIDMSRRSAQALGFQRNGTAKVRVQYLGKAPLDGNDSWERSVNARQPWARYAGLKKPKKTRGRVQFAEAKPANKTQLADPMVVGAIPRQEKQTAPDSWQTQIKAAGLSAAATDELIFIQAAAFQNKGFADNLRNQLANIGPASVFPAEIAGKMYYRVRLGPYARRHEADQVLRAVVNSGSVQARIIRF